MDDDKKAEPLAPATEPVAKDAPAAPASGAEFLKPVMAAIARELAAAAGPDGKLELGGNDEAARQKTAAVVKSIGAGLGQALAEAFGKWAQKIEAGETKASGLVGTVSVEPLDDSDKKPS